MSECMTNQYRIAKYTNPRIPIVPIIVNNSAIENKLIDLGSAINMMTTAVLEFLHLGQFLWPTPSILELANHTTVKPTGVLDDIVVLVSLWEYPVDFMVVESKDPSKGNPIIFGRPWLATDDAYIGCRDREMTISKGLSTQKLALCPLAQTVTENLWWLDYPFRDENIEDIFFPSDYSWEF